MFYTIESKIKYETPKRAKLNGEEVLITGTIENLNGEELFTWRYEDMPQDEFFTDKKKWFSNIEE